MVGGGAAHDHMVWRKACGLYGASFAEKFCRGTLGCLMGAQRERKGRAQIEGTDRR